MAKRLGIVGSRHFPIRSVVQNFVRSLPPETVIVSGGAAGVDSWAVETGNALGLNTIVFNADWRLGRKAGPVRNTRIVRSIDELVAFWDGRSRGTLNAVVQAVNANVPVRVFDSEGVALATQWVLQQAEERGVTAAIERARSMRP
jgi:hypothetical protein